MKLKVDLHSRVPIYIQIVERVKHGLAIGELAPGEHHPDIVLDHECDPAFPQMLEQRTEARCYGRYIACRRRLPDLGI